MSNQINNSGVAPELVYMTPCELTEALTTEEVRHALRCFLDAVYRNDTLPNPERLAADLKAASVLVEDFAVGTKDLAGHSYRSTLAPHAELIRSTERSVSPIEWAARLGCTPAAIRMVRRGDLFKEAA